LSEKFNLAVRTARERLEIQNEMERSIAKNKKVEEEKKPVELARQARQVRTQSTKADETPEQCEEVQKREEFRLVFERTF
jgi:hypothetical protein